ncbi:hypothetical protein HDU92_004326 [Lobulomyces angularis]|nr:hypothetical protein HDU92_004326 [Lobulomyces angularis]
MNSGTVQHSQQGPPSPVVSTTSTVIDESTALLNCSSVNILDADEMLLANMGYKQDLYRGFDAFMSFSFCFTTVGVISGLSGLFVYGMKTGGPSVLIWSWIIGGILNIIVALNLAEICSTYPSAGSVYHWAGCLSSEKNAPLYSYVTGWFNFLGNAAGDAFFAQSFSTMVNALYQLIYPENEPLSMEFQVFVAICSCCFCALQNITRIDRIGWLNNFATFWQVGTTGIIVATLFGTCSASGTTLSSPKEIFFTFYNGTGFDSKFYVAMIGMLTTLYSFTGYEAAGHMSEETKNTQTASPLAIAYTALAAMVVGLLYLIGLLSATASNVENFVLNQWEVTNIFGQCAGYTTGILLAILLTVNMYFSGMSSFTVSTRIAYSMARDGAFPLSKKIAYVSPTNQSPVGSVILVLSIDIILLLLNLVNETTFTAVTSIATIGYQISYAIPILLRVTTSKNVFELGKFNLGTLGIPMGWLSFIWLFCTSVLFLLPTQSPVTLSNMNYTGLILLLTFLIGGFYWIFSARFWFIGPRRHSALIH